MAGEGLVSRVQAQGTTGGLRGRPLPGQRRDLELPPGLKGAPDVWDLGSQEPELCLSESDRPERQSRLLNQHPDRQEKIQTSELTVFPTKAG